MRRIIKRTNNNHIKNVTRHIPMSSSVLTPTTLVLGGGFLDVLSLSLSIGGVMDRSELVGVPEISNSGRRGVFIDSKCVSTRYLTDLGRHHMARFNRSASRDDEPARDVYG